MVLFGDGQLFDGGSLLLQGKALKLNLVALLRNLFFRKGKFLSEFIQIYQLLIRYQFKLSCFCEGCISCCKRLLELTLETLLQVLEGLNLCLHHFDLQASFAIFVGNLGHLVSCLVGLFLVILHPCFELTHQRCFILGVLFPDEPLFFKKREALPLLLNQRLVLQQLYILFFDFDLLALDCQLGLLHLIESSVVFDICLSLL